MNIEKIKEFIALRSELKAAGVIGVSLHEDEVHMNESELSGLENLEIEYDENFKYPYKVSTVKEGVRLFSVMNKENFETFFPEHKGYLVEDVILDGMKEEEIA
jgi:hypothetical protein